MNKSRMPNLRPSIALAATCVFLVLAVVIGVVAWRSTIERRRANRGVAPDTAVLAALIGTPLDPPRSVNDAILRDDRNVDTHLLESNARTTLVFFGYTHCPDACPIALASLGRAYRLLGATARARTRIVFVTVDPARDTPTVIGRYARTFDSHIVALTGDATTLAGVRDAFGVRLDRGSHEISHGTTVFAVDRSRDVRVVYPPDTTAKEFAHDLALLNA